MPVTNNLGVKVYHVVDIKTWWANLSCRLLESRDLIWSPALLSPRREWLLCCGGIERGKHCRIWTRLCVDSPPLAPALLWTFEGRREEICSWRSPQGYWTKVSPCSCPVLSLGSFSGLPVQCLHASAPRTNPRAPPQPSIDIGSLHRIRRRPYRLPRPIHESHNKTGPSTALHLQTPKGLQRPRQSVQGFV